MPIGRGRNIFEIIMGVTGDEQVMASLQQMVKGLGNVRKETTRTTRSSHELGRSFRNIALRTAAYIGIIRSIRAVSDAMKGAVSAGIQYNATIEQSRLAIATLIAAQGELVTAQGETLKGAEKLDAAYQMSVDQVNKLRIAGIQTAATTQELVDAFQQAVGAGLATGLTLDEIRTVTIRIAQAAGALGVPYRQLNEEIRSILGGIIDQNTRIAKSLQITNDQIRAAKEQNRLAEFLLEKFDAFGVAGERIVETWSAFKSNLQEAFELLSGEVTFPAFERVRKAGLDALGRVFDFDTAQITDDFRDLVRSLQYLSKGIGENMADGITAVVEGAISLNQWLKENRKDVALIAASFADLFRNISTGLVNTTKLWVEWTARVGIMRQGVETLGDAFRALSTGPATQIAAIVAGIAASLYLINALAGPTGIWIVGITAAVTALANAVDYWVDTQAEAIETATDLRRAQLDLRLEDEQDLLAIYRKTQEWAKLQKVMEQGQLTTEGRSEAEKQMLEIMGEIERLNPELAASIREVAEAHGDVVLAMRDRLRGEISTHLWAIDANREMIEEAQRGIRDIEFKREHPDLEPQTLGGKIITGLGRLTGLGKESAELAALEERVRKLTAANQDLAESVERYQAALRGLTPELRGPGAEADPKELEGEIQAADARTKAYLDRWSAYLRVALDKNEISYRAYYDELDRLQQDAFRQQIANQERLLAVEEDEKKRGQIEAKITQLRAQAHITSVQNEYQIYALRKKNADELLKVEQKLAEEQGRTAEAAKLKIEEQYKELLADLKTIGNQEGIDLVKQLIDVETYRAEFAEIEKVVSAAQSALRDKIQRIDLEVQTQGITRREGRQKTIEAYQAMRDQIGLLLPDLKRLSGLIQNPEDRAAIQQLINLFEELGLTIEDISDEWKEFRVALESAGTDVLARHMTDAIKESESLGDALERLVFSADALRNILASLAQAIVEVTAQMIAQRAVEAASFAIFGAARGGLVPGLARGGPVAAFGPGGSVRGPGGPTDDKILARLSAGEYVVKASAVRRYGTDFLNAINRGLLPLQVVDIRRFSGGGVVGGERRASELNEFRGQLTIGLSEGLVVDSMNSPAGEKFVLKTLQKHRRSILKGLGG